jgi:hypothetical protein
MWTPQIFIPASKGGVYNTHFGAYGLGWFLNDIRGFEQVSHTGQDDGMISEVSMIPDIQLGITVLSNQEGGGAVRAIIDQITDAYLGIAGTDRVKEWAAKVQANNYANHKPASDLWAEVTRRAAAQTNKPDYSSYTGQYHDNWFGDVQIFESNKQLWFKSVRSPQLTGPMLLFSNHTFLVRWNNPQIKADALVSFTMDDTGKAATINMKRASPDVSFAFDFQDLDFKRSGSHP